VVARALVGTYLVHAPARGAARAVRIVETEAYCGPKDLGGEPVLGIAHGVRCDGPGRLGRAMGITRALNGCDLTGDTLFVAARRRRPRITVTARVGVAYAGEWADEPWRFLETGSVHASRPHARLIGRG
jgi:DNA-3-methyladenine glycosylase